MLFARLVEACRDEWRAYTEHDFVRGLGDGRLPAEAYWRYLVQDYLFLVQFCRAYGLAIYKAADPALMRGFAATLDGILNHEMALHIRQSAAWGLGEAELAGMPEALATVAYTRFVLDRGLQGDLLDLTVALAPCVIGYAEIGRALAGRGGPYAEWIDAYAGAEYQAIAEGARRLLDRLFAASGAGEGRIAGLTETFRLATRLEAAFWDMGLGR